MEQHYPTRGHTCAFPTGDDASPGLTIREHFAVTILAGMMANPVTTEYTTLERSAVEAADKLMAELSKPATALPTTREEQLEWMAQRP